MNLDKLEIDQISKNSLSKISRACRYHKFGKHNEPLKILIEDLLKEELPKPIICILEFIKANFNKNTCHSEYYVYISDCKNTKLMTCPIVKFRNRYPNCSSGTLKNSIINLKIE